MEILAPAGDMLSLKSAVASGADAVYLGAKDFNARSKAENFDNKQLRLAVSYCHERNVRVYLTFNTLVKSNEMKAALRAAAEAVDAGIDAFIVQDLGLLYNLQKEFPDIPYHASTQAGIHNVYGALFAFYAWLVPMQRFSVVRLIPLIGIDMISNLFEICIRLGHDALSPTVLLRLLIVALGRTAVAAICLAALDAYGVFILHRDDRLRYRKLLLLTSQLKSEVIWMNKNTTRIEETMSVSYGLYNQLSALEGEQAQQLAQKALTVAKDIHEIKKEYYLIMSGISSALETDQEENGMWLKNILQIVQDSMRRAFEKDGKKVRIDIALQKNFYTDKHYYLMSVLRNLVNNAAEAAGEERADVLVEQKEENGDCVLQVHDNCGGIAPEYLPTIFEPGFSTKINFETGKVSRGLGLSLVKDIVEEELGGVISVKSQNGCTDFTIRIPRENLEVER